MLQRTLLSLLVLALTASSAAAATQTATVLRKGGVNDGDTIKVRLNGELKTIRFLNLQAMEMTRYSVTPSKWRGECHAVQAAKFVLKKVKQGGYRVRLDSLEQKTDTRNRLERTVEVKIGGRWQDIGEMEMARGLTLWLHNTKSETLNRRYNELAQQAAKNGVGLFDADACGAGPVQDSQLKLWVLSDPIGDDAKDLNGEYVRIQNRGAVAVPLDGWFLSDAGKKELRYHFPAGTTVAPGDYITVRTGAGTDGSGVFYRGLEHTQFENSANGGGAGDGAYLFDPDGDIRAWTIYPCLVSCTDPLQGALRVAANATRGPEYVDVENSSGQAVALFGYQLRVARGGAYGFGPDAALGPGETMRIFVKGSPQSDSRLEKHMGYDGAYMGDTGGTAQVQTFDEIMLACDSWGSGSCP